MSNQNEIYSKKKVVSSRLTLDEIRFLRKLGNGDLSAGIRRSMERAGYHPSKEMVKGYRVIKEIVGHSGKRSSKYSLFLNGELVGNPLTVSDSIYKALEERHGKHYVMEDVIIRSFISLPSEVDIDKVYDLDGNIVWSKYN